MGGMTMVVGHTGHAAAGYLGMWMAMMVPMMLPSLLPMLARYHPSVGGAKGIHRHGRTALVALGYFVVWAVLGMAAYAAGEGILAVEMRWGTVARWLPVAAGVVIVLAGGVQGSAWKARRLAACREGSGCGCRPAPTYLGAWRHGLGFGLKCSLCCGSLMVVLLALGMMDLVAMSGVTLAISAERLAPAPLRVARITGAAIVAIGVLAIARV
jgi:predicted metal-binding membrane protein